VTGFIILAVLLLLFWLLLIRPQRRRQVEQHRMQEELELGDEIVTAGGLYGTVTEFAGEDVMVEVAPKVRVRIARRAIAAIVSDEEEELEPAPEAESAPDGEAGG
jgi:preprotein translocase subunit YajC